ncbi:hypothetical protein JCM19233_7152 [Vibrio astriarenae]|nr:hypothetical protein JCM19233_7152 [Vibrio sp. C7]
MKSASVTEQKPLTQAQRLDKHLEASRVLYHYPELKQWGVELSSIQKNTRR